MFGSLTARRPGSTNQGRIPSEPGDGLTNPKLLVKCMFLPMGESFVTYRSRPSHRLHNPTRRLSRLQS